MKQFSVFLDDDRFSEGSLEEHIHYLKKYGGTPDSWSNPEDLKQAVEDADRWVKIDCYVTDDNYDIIYTSLMR